MLRLLAFLLVWCFFIACSSEGKRHGISTGGAFPAFLEGAKAEGAITTDTTEAYFQRVGMTDVLAQWRELPVEVPSLPDLRLQHQERLKESVKPWIESEKRFLGACFQRVVPFLEGLHSNFVSPAPGFIRTDGSFYGASVFYTRERNIVFPDMLPESSWQTEALLVHELSHIFTRFHPEIKRQLYAAIGFFPLRCPLKIPEVVQNRLLWNPDGLDFSYGIQLLGDTAFWAWPAIISQAEFPWDRKLSYFENITFQLFPLIGDIEGTDTCNLRFQELGRSALKSLEDTDYYQQITFNTRYSIHPDEIIAENIRLLYLQQYYPQYLPSLEPNGLALLNRLDSIFRSSTN